MAGGEGPQLTRAAGLTADQDLIGPRRHRARTVADDWVEARQRSFEGIKAAMSASDPDNLSHGAAAADVAVTLSPGGLGPVLPGGPFGSTGPRRRVSQILKAGET
ncbi:hypothetical protein ACWF9B_00915 [Streptomyces sp. NPDC055089]